MKNMDDRRNFIYSLLLRVREITLKLAQVKNININISQIIK